MRTRLTLFLGIFSVMALSNAIVPVLPSYSADASVHGMIYAAYFLGAFAITLPAGVLSDRYGRIPLIRLGLIITVAAGLILTAAGGFTLVVVLRFIEGLGAGLFVAAAMSYVNSHPDHVHMSGWFMAFLNAGLVAGLLLAGELATVLHMPASGILLFSLLAAIPVVCSLLVREPVSTVVTYDGGTITFFIAKYRWLWYSAIVLIGITGVVTTLYPKFSGASSDILGFWIAGMSVATIAAVLIYSRVDLPPAPAIRWCAVLLGVSVLLSFFSAAGFFLIGALAGIVMIAQMAFLASVREHQGIVMGLFSTTSFLGMALLPVAAGFVAEGLGFLPAFCFTAILALTVALTIGRCACVRGAVSYSDLEREKKEQ
jgi:MFS family permease